MSSDESVEIVVDAEPSAKRKRSSKEADELEIDVNLPEPPSKKAKRKEKRDKKSGKDQKKTDAVNGDDITTIPATTIPDKPSNSERKAAKLALKDRSDLLEEATPVAAQSKHGEYGVWIGNLPFTATRDTVRDFLQKHADIEESDITRLHLPGPTKQGGRKQAEQHNRGFAYVDFTTKEITEKAIAVSEKLVDGRRLLIKDSKNFEGRPPKKAQDSEGNVNIDGEEVKGKKGPTKRVFVGNLDFEVTRDDLYELFAPAGTVEDVFIATFEDTGKCKGFGWVTFASVAGAETAVKGFLYRETVEDDLPAAEEDDDVEEPSKKKSRARRQKVWVNRIHGRDIRCEFAEDPQTRYKKRFGKDKPEKPQDREYERPPIRNVIPQRDNSVVVQDAGTDALGRSNDKREAFRQIFSIPDDSERKNRRLTDGRDRGSRPQGKGKPDKEERRDERRKRHDARTIAPGQALANTQRASGAIVAGKGQKVTFD